MNLGVISALIRNDLRQLLRTPQVLVFSVALPMLLWPLVMWISSLSVERRIDRIEGRTYRYALAPELEAEARSFIERALAERTSGGGSTGAAGQTVAAGSVRLEEVEAPDDPSAALAGRTIEVFLGSGPIRPGSAEESEARETAAGAARAPPDDRTAPDAAGEEHPAPRIILSYRADIDSSETAESTIRRALERLRIDVREERLEAAGFPLPTDGLLPVERVDAATDAQAAGFVLGRILSVMLVLMILGGGAIVAMDTLAGEKERGTIETLLTTAASRTEIVVGKNGSILVVALGVTALQLGNLVLWMRLDIIPVPASFQLDLTPLLGVLLLVLYLPVALLLSSALLLVSGRSKTVKEAQLLLFPVTVSAGALAAAPVLPGLELGSAIVVVPIANLCVAARDALAGNLNWPLATGAWIVTFGAAAGLARASVRALSAERLITASDMDAADLSGGPALFPRRVWGWFAVLWALLLVWQMNAAASLDPRLVISINLGVLGLASWLMIRRYRLPVRETLSLRAPSASAWAGVLIGAPAGLVAADGLVRLASLAMPIPEEWIEAMAETMGAELPLWQTLLFFAFLPGILEELAFRGVLLHGLRQRLQALRLALAGGLAFGVFHVDLFRIAPTTFLGILLVWSVVRSGSIFPAMAWHALHNGLAFVSARSADADAVEPRAWWHYLLAAAALFVAFRLLRPPRADAPAGLARDAS